MKQTIGCQATISFLPELGLRGIEAKIDTGAYYSALHCSSVRVFRKGGQRMLRFTVLDAKHPAYSDITF